MKINRSNNVVMVDDWRKRSSVTMAADSTDCLLSLSADGATAVMIPTVAITGPTVETRRWLLAVLCKGNAKAKQSPLGCVCLRNSPSRMPSLSMSPLSP